MAGVMRRDEVASLLDGKSISLAENKHSRSIASGVLTGLFLSGKIEKLGGEVLQFFA
ncbi:hypothetical protein QE390_003705 [Siphonobacter sp. SORGH_AS 1065]|nr:hypothetical protein [Siphonobacter sp. SORGH_AS_1065]